MSNADANHVKFTHAHQIAKKTCRNGTSCVEPCPSPIAPAKWCGKAATAITKVRSKSSSSWLEARCGSSVERRVMRVRIWRLTTNTDRGAPSFVTLSQTTAAVRSCLTGSQSTERLLMKIVVIGGTGLIGSQVVAKLGEHGHEAIAASPDTGVNTLTGEGLPEVLEGADVVIDVSNSPSFEDAAVLEFFQTSTSNLLAAEKAAGVGHHVALSVVGTERMADKGYFKAKSRAGAADRRLRHPLLDRARDAVLRVHQEHRRAGDRRRHGPAPAGAVPADGLRGRRQGRRPDRGRRAGERDRRGRRPGRSSAWTSSSARRCRPATIRARSSPTRTRATSATTQVDDSTLVPADGAMLGEVRFQDWLERQLATA